MRKFWRSVRDKIIEIGMIIWDVLSSPQMFGVWLALGVTIIMLIAKAVILRQYENTPVEDMPAVIYWMYIHKIIL